MKNLVFSDRFFRAFKYWFILITNVIVIGIVLLSCAQAEESWKGPLSVSQLKRMDDAHAVENLCFLTRNSGLGCETVAAVYYNYRETRNLPPLGAYLKFLENHISIKVGCE